MAHDTLQAGAPDAPLPPGMTLKLEAIDPTTGLDVAGVTVSRWTIYGYDANIDPGQADDVTPLLQPTQVAV